MRRLALLALSAFAVAAPLGACDDTFISISSNGDIRVFIHTNGRDAEGWRVRVDGGVEQVVTRGGSVTLAGLGEGSHLVELTGVATGCRVVGANPRRVVVSADGIASVAFNVVCGG